ncbi:MAG: 8-oxoguanine deaminase [Candidatus Riflebacteria bacterium]|nr:8-oxoguanine deaminase [Candidatus Riflebacteria bacterium]
MAPRTILIKNALLVATMDDARTTVPGGDVHLEGNRVVAVGRDLQVHADLVLDARDCVVLPGFVNCHHHMYQTLTRAIPAVQDEPLFGWLLYLYHVWKHFTPEAVETGALVGLGELLLTGCTTSADHYYVFPRSQPGDLLDRTIDAARTLGIRFHPTRGSMSLGKSKGGLPPDETTQTEEEILADCERLVSRYHDPAPYSMCRIGLAPCSPFSVTAQLMRDTVTFARKRGLLCHTHLAETLDEERFCLEKFGKRPLAYMEELGWLGRDVWYAHAIHLNDEEIAKMAATGTGVGHCPTSNLRLGSGIAPIRQMMDAGVPVGLGVDGSASNDSSDMLGELRSCMLVHRIKSGVASMPARDVFWLACRGGARVLGRDDVGSLEPGKAADVVLWDLSALGFAGAHHDPLAALLYAGDSHLARTVLVDGKVVVKDGHLVHADEKLLAEKANRIARELAAKV